MLTAKEYQLNIVCFEVLSYFCIIPFQIKGLDVKYPKRHRLLLWCALLVFQVFHLAVALWLMLSKVISVGQDAIPTLTLDYCAITLATLGIYFGTQNFIRFPEVAQCVFKSVHECDIDRCEKNGGFLGYTYLEVYTMLAPLGMYPAAVALVTAYCVVYVWQMTQGYPLVVRILLMFVNALNVTSQISWVHFGVIAQITFMENVGLTAQRHIQHLQQHNLQSDQIQRMSKIIQKLRALQVDMNVFNESQKNLIFGFKLGTMYCVTFCGFAAIEFFQADLVMGVFNLVAVIETIFAFAFIYNKGFAIPRSIQSLRRSFMFCVRWNRGIDKSEWIVLSRQIRSVRKMAVLVGNFHYLQRVSTPNFVDFCVKNMVRLVMFYRRYKA